MGKIFANYIPNKRLESRIYKYLLQLKNKNVKITQLENDLNRHFCEEDI